MADYYRCTECARHQVEHYPGSPALTVCPSSICGEVTYMRVPWKPRSFGTVNLTQPVQVGFQTFESPSHLKAYEKANPHLQRDSVGGSRFRQMKDHARELCEKRAKKWGDQCMGTYLERINKTKDRGEAGAKD